MMQYDREQNISGPLIESHDNEELSKDVIDEDIKTEKLETTGLVVAELSPNNEPLIAQCTLQIEDLQQFKAVLAAKTYKEFVQKYTDLKNWLPSRNYIPNQFEQMDVLFDYFDFLDDEYDLRTQKIQEIMQELKHIAPNDTRLTQFLTKKSTSNHSNTLFNLFYFTITEINYKKSTNLPLCVLMEDLLNLQIEKLQIRLEELLPAPCIAAQSSFDATSISAVEPPPTQTMSSNTILAIAGAGLVSASILLNLCPKFALLLGIHLSPTMFVIFVVAGASMAIYGLSHKDPENSPPSDGHNSPTQDSLFFSLQYLKSCFGFWSREEPATPTASIYNAVTSDQTMSR